MSPKPRKDESARANETPGPSARGEARKAYLLRVNPELLSALRSWSNQEFRSLNAHIEYLLSEAVKKHRRQK